MSATPDTPRSILEHVALSTEADRLASTLQPSFLILTEHLTVQFREISKIFKQLPDLIKATWSVAVARGWYPTPESSFTIDEETLAMPMDLDDFMVNELKASWAALQLSLTEKYPHRKAVIECAVLQHESQCFIASIPLFLAQADGIVAEEIGAHFFTDKDTRKEKLLQLESDSDAFSASLLSILGIETQFQAGISKSRARDKILAPNRNGILHGSRKHLDYGTELNSYKAFSLLCFVAFALKEISSASAMSHG